MSNGESRPDPDAILQRLKSEEERSTRAKLHVFFGYAPGVGKTYRMLGNARELVVQGWDIVVGAVETHGRYDTASLVLGLELLPLREVLYRGVKLREFDLEVALARRPRVVLLDELAHTNAPGGRHPKRWQDVADLLAAGIEVHTTVNVQHLESLNDVVAQITSVRVRETIPDQVLDRADQIEMVYVTPDELLERLREGRVYLRDQALRARDHFFKRGNLLALRELALRRIAERVDADVQAYREEHRIESTWPAAERILVCVSSAPSSAKLVRAGRRMAAGLRAPWVAAYVESTASAPLSEPDQVRLESHLRLAQSLGATVARLVGDKQSRAILAYARENNVTRIILGKPTHSRLRDILRGSLLDEVVRGSGDIEVHALSGDEPAAEARTQARRGLLGMGSRIDLGLRPRRGYLRSSVLVALATAVGWLGRGTIGMPDLAMLYLLVITVVALRFGRGPSILAAALSVAAYDFFFVSPYFTFAVSDVRNLLTFATMFAVGLLISDLTLRIRRQEHNAREREMRSAALYSLSRELATASTETQAAEVVADHCAQVVRGGAAVHLADEGGSDLKLAARVGPVPGGAEEQAVAKWVVDHRQPAGLGTDTLPGAKALCLPFLAGGAVLGTLSVVPGSASTVTFEERDVLESFVRQGALAITRARLAEEAKTAVLRARTEEMRSSLLSAVSHDLRTPLGVITGSATALRDETPGMSKDQRAELVDTICEEAERLARLVGNLLDMTRVESGGLQVKREWVPVEELVGSALTRLERQLAGRSIATDIPADLPLVSVDPVLMQQVLVNLLENAVKYNPPGSPIQVRARPANGALVLEVIDSGPGIPAGTEGKIFEKFYRGPHTGIAGAGLGLPICRGIVEAHDGSIRAERRDKGGAIFRVTLPLVGVAPPVLMDEVPAP
jgi:two-component system sensor histidine kinase KdpD